MTNDLGPLDYTHHTISLQNGHCLQAHRIVFWTKSFSNRPTSFLNVSISCQQSSGRRSWVRRQATTASLALATSASTWSSFLRLASFWRSCSTSCLTLLLLMSFCRSFSASVALEDVASVIFSTSEGSLACSGSPDSVSLNLEKLADSWSRSFWSSAVRRSWYWSSCWRERVESVWGRSQRHSSLYLRDVAGRTKVFFCMDPSSSVENLTGWSLRAYCQRRVVMYMWGRSAAIGAAEGHARGEDMLLDLGRGFRVLCAHGCVGGAAGCVR
jgi:hypothetical protein